MAEMWTAVVATALQPHKEAWLCLTVSKENPVISGVTALLGRGWVRGS